jgi:hypothetical protein
MFVFEGSRVVFSCIMFGSRRMAATPCQCAPIHRVVGKYTGLPSVARYLPIHGVVGKYTGLPSVTCYLLLVSLQRSSLALVFSLVLLLIELDRSLRFSFPNYSRLS